MNLKRYLGPEFPGEDFTPSLIGPAKCTKRTPASLHIYTIYFHDCWCLMPTTDKVSSSPEKKKKKEYSKTFPQLLNTEFLSLRSIVGLIHLFGGGVKPNQLFTHVKEENAAGKVRTLVCGPLTSWSNSISHFLPR